MSSLKNFLAKLITANYYFDTKSAETAVVIRE